MAECVQNTGIEREMSVCAVCGRPPVDAKLLDCLHTACGQCLHGLVNEVTIVCPSCQHPTKLISGVMALPDNHILSEFSESKVGGSGGTMTCDECDDDEDSLAVARCRSCSVKLCDVHVASHRKSRRTKQHELDDLVRSTGNGECRLVPHASVVEPPAKCHLHGELLGLYCSTCRRVICARCVPYGHGKHTKGPLTEELVIEAKKRLERIVESSKMDDGCISELEKAIDRAERWMSKIEERAERVSNEITAHFDKLRRLLAEREEDLLATLGREQKSLTSPYEEIVSNSTKTLSSYKLAFSAAEASLRLCDKIAVLEEEGVLSRRFECLALESKRSTTSVSLSIPEECASALMGFTPRCDSERVGEFAGCLVSNFKVHIVRAEHLHGQTLRLCCKVAVARFYPSERGGEAALKATLGSLKFSLSRQSQYRSGGCVSDATSGLVSSFSSDFPIACAVQDFHVKCVNSGNTEFNVAYTLLSEKPFSDGFEVLVEMDNLVVGCCEITSDIWRFQSEYCPRSVAISEDGKKAWTTSYENVRLVVNTELSHGHYSWRVEALASGDFFSMAAGVTTTNKQSTNNWKELLTGQDRAKGRIVQGEHAAGKKVEWSRNDVLLFELDCSARTLSITNTRTGNSDTIEGIQCPVYPCFGFCASERGVRFLSN